MRFLCYYSVILIWNILYQNTTSSFLYGKPCSERNTAYLYVSTWRLPKLADINCIDITGLKKSMNSVRLNLSNYTYFIDTVKEADTLYADHMDLKRFPITILLALPNIELIDMSGNNLTKIAPKMHRISPKLTKFLLPENRVSIPKRKPLMTSLTLSTLMLTSNGITNIYKFTFAKLPAIEVLYLDSNSIKFVTPAMFSPMKNLKYLHLGRNYLTRIPPRDVMPKSVIKYIIKSQQQVSSGVASNRTIRHRRQ